MNDVQGTTVWPNTIMNNVFGTASPTLCLMIAFRWGQIPDNEVVGLVEGSPCHKKRVENLTPN